MKKYYLYPILIFLIVAFACKKAGEKESWIEIFNGVNLDGWIIKFSGCEVNENYLNTFRVEDSILIVSYENYEAFNNRYGHIFYKVPYSHYRLKLEYRFVGDKLPDSPWWTSNNSGVMIHSQTPESMPLIPDPMDVEVDLLEHFPLSIECQLLGAVNTANVCQIGALIDIDGQLASERNINSNSISYPPEKWVSIELIVLGDSIVHHIVEGDTVLTYTNLRIANSNKPLSKGYIALQAESQPVEFRSIKLLPLKAGN